MPGRKSYGPAGKWIHDRAHRLMREGDLTKEYGKKKGKSVAYAIATQQAHKVKKSPKKFRTPTGVRVAKAKHDKPLKEYRKTASLSQIKLAAMFDELENIEKEALSIRGIGKGIKRVGQKIFGRKPKAPSPAPSAPAPSALKARAGRQRITPMQAVKAPTPEQVARRSPRGWGGARSAGRTGAGYQTMRPF